MNATHNDRFAQNHAGSQALLKPFGREYSYADLQAVGTKSISDLRMSHQTRVAYREAKKTMENAVKEVQNDMDHQKQRR